MKTFLLTMGAALGMSVIAYASDAVPNQDDLRPADELAQADGLVIDGASGDAALNMDDYRPYPPRPPRPPRTRAGAGLGTARSRRCSTEPFFFLGRGAAAAPRTHFWRPPGRPPPRPM